MDQLRYIFGSHTAPVGPFRVGSHHLARELSRMGNHVTHVSLPISFLHLLRARDASVRARFSLALRSPSTDTAGAKIVVPAVPIPLRLLGPSGRAFELHKSLGGALRRWFKELQEEGTDVLLLDEPLLLDLLDLTHPKLTVYRPTDIQYRQSALRAEVLALRKADAVVATSHVVLSAVSHLLPPSQPTMILENGVEFDRFTDATLGESREGVVYVGSLDGRFNWSLTSELARAFPGVRFRIAGPAGAGVPDRLPSNVQLLGPVPYCDLPRLLAKSSVGILPMSDDVRNAGRSPMKYYEYLAAGLWVVASWTPTLATRSAPGVWLAKDVAEMVSGLRSALDRKGQYNSAGRTHSQGYSWTARALELHNFVTTLL